MASSRSSSCSTCARLPGTPIIAARSPGSTRPARPPTAAAGSAASPAGRPSRPSWPTAGGRPDAAGDPPGPHRPARAAVARRGRGERPARVVRGPAGRPAPRRRVPGAVHLVNPRYREVAGLTCHASLADVPGPVALVVLAVPNAALEVQLEGAAAAGVPAAVIFASCIEPHASGPPNHPPVTVPPLAERLAAIARGAGMAVCGGNGMGFFNLDQSLRVCGYPEPPDLAPGPVAVVTHSGSVFSALLHNDRGLGFNLVVSAGNELVTSAAGYLDHAVELPTTRVVALFLETVREPAAFRAALAKAAAHSGALAGEDGAYQALFDTYGVAQVATLDELADTCELLAGRRAHPGALAAIGDSGGE